MPAESDKNGRAVKQGAFKPVDVLRQIEAEYVAKAESGNGTFEAFSSLGCETGRVGDPANLVAILHGILGDSPFSQPERSVRLKMSAKSRKPVVLEVSAPPGAANIDDTVEPLIQQMGGTLVVLSPADAGLAVRITLPLEEFEGEDSQDEATQTVEGTNLEGMRILVADDSPTNRIVLEEMLADTHAQITSVTDGQEALDAWLNNSFDLLLLDISMPVMDGVTALKRIRSIEVERNIAPTAAVAVTANALVNQVADYLVAGFDSHLAKPFRRNDLLHAITTLRK